jgi:exodeoxyribonuclease-3
MEKYFARMKIASFNINSIKAHHDQFTAWLKESQPDVVCLQETKCADDAFPTLLMEAEGYRSALFGQKTYNGVAILSKYPIEDVRRGLPELEDDQSRYIEAVIATPNGAVRVASIYLPNGNPVGSDKYPYKLQWLERLAAHARSLLALEEPLVLAGDYNVIPTADDVYDAASWVNDALFKRETRLAFGRLVHLGFTDALRACHAEPHLYTFWDYQAGAWQKNRGLRIDHLLLSPQAADRLVGTDIDKHVRGWERPSDHVPIWCELEMQQ